MTDGPAMPRVAEGPPAFADPPPPQVFADALLLATAVAHGFVSPAWLDQWRAEHAATVGWLRDAAVSPTFPATPDPLPPRHQQQDDDEA